MLYFCCLPCVFKALVRLNCSGPLVRSRWVVPPSDFGCHLRIAVLNLFSCPAAIHTSRGLPGEAAPQRQTQSSVLGQLLQLTVITVTLCPVWFIWKWALSKDNIFKYLKKQTNQPTKPTNKQKISVRPDSPRAGKMLWETPLLLRSNSYLPVVV